VLARDAGDWVRQAHRFIVLREQARLPQVMVSVGAVLARESGDSVRQAHRVIVHREQARLLQITERVGAVLARAAPTADRDVL